MTVPIRENPPNPRYLVPSNSFCDHIKPGKYYILNYWWTQSKWYGGKMYAEPIFKGIDATENFNERVNSGELVTEKLVRYEFVIEPNVVYYLGTWCK